MTNEFSFILKPSEHGIGVFTTQDIKKGEFLRLFGDEELEEDRVRVLNESDVPSEFQGYCMGRGGQLICPEDFGAMPIGWYLNHSSEQANAVHKNYNWYAFRDISAGEEIFIDYNTLEEPEDDREGYYNE